MKVDYSKRRVDTPAYRNHAPYQSQSATSTSQQVWDETGNEVPAVGISNERTLSPTDLMNRLMKRPFGPTQT